MKYRLTPLNIVGILLLGFSGYALINLDGWGVAFFIILLPLAVFSFIFDFVLQKFLPKYLWTFLIEVSILGSIYFWNIWTERTKTFIIPDDLQFKHVVLIYGVDDAPKLPNGWNYEVKVPKDGILLTSSAKDDDLPETKMQTFSGKRLNTYESWIFWHFSSDTLVCNNKTYYFRSWLVDRNRYINKTGDIDRFKINLKRQFCNHRQERKSKTNERLPAHLQGTK